MSIPERDENTALDDAAAALAEERAEEEAEQRSYLQSAFGDYGYVVMPSDAVAPILDAPTRLALSEWLAEMRAVRELKAVGIVPRTRVILDGPPGCGKTTFAHHIAARLGIPMVTIVANSIVSKYVGESAKNIGKIFRAARTVPEGVVLFFDEFDAIARDRGSEQEKSNGHNEGLTISILAELDRHEGMVFGATNQEGRIDPAVQRRFNLKIGIGLPGAAERAPIIRLYMKPYALDEGIVSALSDAMTGASPALIKEICEALKRGLVLGPKVGLPIDIAAIMRRAVATIKPHPSITTVPKLWGGVSPALARLEEAAEGHWPPATF